MNVIKDVIYFSVISFLMILALAVFLQTKPDSTAHVFLLMLLVAEILILAICWLCSCERQAEYSSGLKSPWMCKIHGVFGIIIMIMLWYILLAYIGLNDEVSFFAISAVILLLTFAVVSRGDLEALSVIKKLFLGNFLGLSISFLILLGFLATAALFWYTPTHFTLEPKAIEESFYINNSSRSTVETIAIRNLGADLRGVNISVEGSAIRGIAEGNSAAGDESSNNIYITLDQKGNFSLLSRERKFISAMIDASRAKMAGEYRGTINVIAAGNDIEHYKKSIPIIIKIKFNESVKSKDKNNATA